MKPLDSMNLKTCERCGRFYETFLELNHCPECYRKLEEKLEEVRKFLSVHVDANLEEVSVALKVERKQLIAWMRDNRLRFPAASEVTIPCLRCETPIAMGRYCAMCRKDIMDDLESVYEDRSGRKKGILAAGNYSRMNYMDRNRRSKR